MASTTSPRLIAQPIVPMFRDPNLLSEQVSQALLAIPVRDLEARGDWLRVSTPDGYQGWIEARAAVAPPEGWEGPWVEVNDLWVNLRYEPHYMRAVRTQAFIGARLPVLGCGGEEERFTQVLLPDGEPAWTESHRLLTIDERPPRPATVRAICRTARRFLGVPYLWGGCGPLGLDCSGFVQLVLRLHGIPIDRDASDQARQGLPSAQPDRADLVFFGPVEEPERITHVGLMLDPHRFIHAAGGDRVRIDPLLGGRHERRFRFARRYAPPER